MKNVMALVLCVLLGIGLIGCSGSEPSYYGVWSIDGLLPDAPMGNFSEENLETIMNVSLTFSAEEATCFGDQIDSLGQTVSDPEYITIDIPKDSFEAMTGTSFDSLGIKGSNISQVSVVNDPSYNDGIVFYVVNDETLLANSLGTFFVFKKTE
jgi:hypothetical protein